MASRSSSIRFKMALVRPITSRCIDIDAEKRRLFSGECGIFRHSMWEIGTPAISNSAST